MIRPNYIVADSLDEIDEAIMQFKCEAADGYVIIPIELFQERFMTNIGTVIMTRLDDNTKLGFFNGDSNERNT